MPLSDWQGVPLVTTGDMWTAAQHNTYIRQNQQALYDGLTGGSGAGSNADKVDGRDAEPGVYPGLVSTDHAVTIALTNNVGKWYTIAEFEYSINATFHIALYGYNVIDEATLYLSADAGSSTLRLHSVNNTAGFCCYRSLLAVRLVRDPNDSEHGWIQVYVKIGYDDTYSRSLEVYAINNPRRPGAAYSLSVTNQPPSDATVASVYYLQNGSWRLARALTGAGGDIGWSTSTQKSAWTCNYDCMIDSNTSTGCTSMGPYDSEGPRTGQSVIVDTKAPTGVSQVRIYTDRENASYYQGAEIYASDDNTNWTHLGTAWAQCDACWVTLDLGQTYIYRYWKFVLKTQGGEKVWFNEIDLYLTVSLQIAGVPVGSTVSLYDSDGNLLEQKRHNDVTYNPVLLSTPVTSIDKIAISKPDGTTAWLEYPVGLGAVDGGALTTGVTLTLYSEA